MTISICTIRVFGSCSLLELNENWSDIPKYYEYHYKSNNVSCDAFNLISSNTWFGSNNMQLVQTDGPFERVDVVPCSKEPNFTDNETDYGQDTDDIDDEDCEQKRNFII